MDPLLREPEIVLVEGSRILHVGSRELLAAAPTAEVVDLAGRTLVPGFVDAHHHLSWEALHPLWADLRQVADLDELEHRLKASATSHPEVEWVRGHSWWEFETGLTLTRSELDSLGIGRPVAVGCQSGHRGVVCSAGLEALGIGRSTPDPPNGRIERDARGVPTGLLVEGAWGDAFARLTAEYADPDRWGELIERRCRELLAVGITAVHDAAVSPAAEQVYWGLAAEGRLPIGVLAMPHPARKYSTLLDGRWGGPPTGEGDEQFRIGPVKLFADGAGELAIDAHCEGDLVQMGMLFPGLADAMATAVERGFGVAVHAMGNAGLRATLENWGTVTRGRSPEHGLRIEHVTLAGGDEVRAMRDLGVAGVVQPGFVQVMGDLVGPPLDDATWMPFADLLTAGVALGASSDSPCAPCDPLVESRFGVSRRTAAGCRVEPEQSVPMREWLRLYTAGAADAGGQAGERGRIAAGLRADFVVLEGDIDGEDALGVAETWVGGERVYAPRDGMGLA